MPTPLVSAARLALEVAIPTCCAVLAALLLKATGWPSLMPPLLMSLLVLRLDRVKAPEPAILAASIAGCVLLLVARGPRLRRLRLAAIVICALATATLQLAGLLT
jgi:hypothetical protein